MGVEVLQP